MRVMVTLVAGAVLLGCHHENEPAKTSEKEPPKCTAEHTARTAGEGAKTGVVTAGMGVKQAGEATAGLFEGGGDEAKRRWNEGKAETKSTAREGAAKTREEAHADGCK